jgi:apolipoprotein D and lipocalin family protein
MRLLATAFVLLCLSASPAVAIARDTAGEATGPAIDLPRYMGTWYVIARIPNPVERGDVAARNEYSLEDHDKVAVRYVARQGFKEPEREVNVRARVLEDSGNRLWRMWFYRVVPTRYRIVEVAPDYSWALVDYPGRDLAWVFARSPDMDRGLYRDLVARLRDRGINTDKLRRVPQTPEQADRLGFDVPGKP